MTETVTVALVTAGSSVLIAVTALLLNYRGFNSLERRLEVLEHDVKEFFKLVSRFDTEIARLKDHTGLK